MARIMQQRLHEVWQQPEALGDDALIRRERQQILDDQAEALAPEPVEGFKHGLRRAIDPPLVHAHLHELGQVRTVAGPPSTRVVAHRLVRRIEPQAMLVCQAARDRGLAGAAGASDPIDMPQSAGQRAGVATVLLCFGLCHVVSLGSLPARRTALGSPGPQAGRRCFQVARNLPECVCAITGVPQTAACADAKAGSLGRGRLCARCDVWKPSRRLRSSLYSRYRLSPGNAPAQQAATCP
jgi:hypothetical protein